MKVLHISGHLGGGVGRVLSAVATYNRCQGGDVEDSFICLETPRDRRYADAIEACGARLLISPDETTIRREIALADIVQLEWWHHPVMAATLARLGDVPARWVVWSHTSGLHYPSIPIPFGLLPHAFVATTPATVPLLEKGDSITTCIASTGGFDEFPLPRERIDRPVRCGYLGSLNSAKMHPDIVSYIEAVARPEFTVEFYGDSSVNSRLEEKARVGGKQSPIQLYGFCKRPQDILPELDLFIYLLNPTHYGTTENALLEAMACGVVPIVLNNPVERGIVQDGVTGFVVDSIEQFKTAVSRLLDNAALRQSMGRACSESVRRDYSVAYSTRQWAEIYRSVETKNKKTIDFTGIFGKTPADWFLSCLGRYADCFAEDTKESRARRLALPFLYERSKSSVFQFRAIFSDDARLAAWESMLYKDEASLSIL